MFKALRTNKSLMPTRQLMNRGAHNGVAAALRVTGDAKTENARLRRSLALSYRLMDRLGLNEGACNHLTVKAPMAKGGGGHVMLLAPGEYSSHIPVLVNVL